jgi:ribonuclease HI
MEAKITSTLHFYTDGGIHYTKNEEDAIIGGVAVVILNNNKSHLGNISKYEISTKDDEDIDQITSNKMEMLAVIKALEHVYKRLTLGTKKYLDIVNEVKIYSDSAYVVNGINQFIPTWKQNGWKTYDKKDVKNQEFWEYIDSLVVDLRKFKVKVFFNKVKGHSTNENNNLADSLVQEAVARGKQQYK